jgi:hypothetical protein
VNVNANGTPAATAPSTGDTVRAFCMNEALWKPGAAWFPFDMWHSWHVCPPV